MEAEPDPCNVCRGTETYLIDGFYYCIECGTQNTNVIETVIEEKPLADGTFLQSNRRKIIQLKKDGIEMSGEWYKWHAFNFIISDLADELVSLGAKPTFKTKLLWIWLRYIKKYQNKSELMMHKTTHGDNVQTGLPSFMEEEDNIPEAEEKANTTNVSDESKTKKKKCDKFEGSRRDIKFLSKGVIMAMLYLALNFDESEIQLSHLYRFVQDKVLSILDPKKFVPDEINVKKIPEWLNFVRSKLCNQHQLRALAMSLLRILDLGTPKVPDLKKIVNNFLTELCLPNDMKPFIFSLMYLHKFDDLDVNNKAKCLIRVPDYEGTVMAYILVAIKICFGLDDKYEIKLSETVEKINEEGDLQKSYKIGKYSEPSNRLFSFREWSNYIQFRKIMLSKHNLRIAEKNCLEIDDYLHFEQRAARPTNNEELPDKISMDIISKLPLEHDVGVIPKESFIPSLTPISEYTDIVIEHCQDPEVTLMLAEDFKRYSLKYICEDLELIDANMENVIKGVTDDGKEIENDFVLGNLQVTEKVKTTMVYVKNCENRNWLTTKPPKMEHITYVDEVNEINDKEKSDHGYDSQNTSRENDVDIVIDKTDEKPKEVNKQKIITEEDPEVNIFDDDFVELDIKDECERYNFYNHNLSHDGNEDDAQIRNDLVPNEDFDRRSDTSDEMIVPAFNPESFDKQNTIKELILFKCSKYHIPVPSEYKTKAPRKRKQKIFVADGSAPVKRSKRDQNRGKVTVKELLSNYNNRKVQQETVRNTELESIHSEKGNDISHSQISFVERTLEIGNEETSSIQSNRISILGRLDERNLHIDVINRTDTNDKMEKIDENTENRLFEDDTEMNLDDLIQKGDPEFDEEKYNIDQLYVKVEGRNEEILVDIKDDPELDQIVLKKMKECELGINIEEVQPQLLKKDIIEEEGCDSEDEIPLSPVKEEMYQQEDNFENLIKRKDIPEYKYWIRHYPPQFMLRSTDLHTKFDDELKENTPISFYFVIQECASIANCTNFYLYKNMQILEENLLGGVKNTKTNIHE